MGVASVRALVAAACERVHRSPDAVSIVAAVKYATDDEVADLLAAGIADLGENRPQQLRDRSRNPVFAGARWHAIGRLQLNKVRYVADDATAFHALADVEVARALAARRFPRDPLRCFVQVNLSGEPTKAGVSPDAARALVEQTAALDGLRIVGLMTMPPIAEEPEASRRWFRALRALAAEFGLVELSMGTSQDYEVAVEEGATAIRVGSALLSPPP